MHTFVALLVFVIGLLATGYYWRNLRQSVNSEMNVAFGRQTQSITQSMQDRIHLYENFLRGSAGLFAIHSGLTQADWEEYHKPYDIANNYADIQGIGVSRYLLKSDVPAYLERRAAQGDTDFKIFPEGDRDVYVPVTFNAAYTGNNGKSRGYDGYTDPVRHQAMDYALTNNRTSISGSIKLVSEARNSHNGIIMYLPVYISGRPINTLEERRKAILGFVYVALDMTSFVDGILAANQNPNVALQLFDSESNSTTAAYESQNFAAIKAQSGALTRTSDANMYGHKWRVVFAASPALISTRQRQLPEQALWRGFITCLFFAGLVWYLITDRERKYARQKQQEVQTAKDDLLSLASHQLRTPATVVKQYVGMLLQGYAGKVSQQQLDMLNSAYDSNERQLEIINQLLYVARLDAGRITLHTKPTDMSKMWQDVARDHSESITTRRQQLSFKLPKKPLTAEVDPHYMRMVLENLLSNAVKYTPEKGSIILELGRIPGWITMRVIDTGVGIDPAVQANIFEKFTRVENELSNDVNGSGVGLYLTKQIVELHGGTIAVQSKPGEGSKFTVKIPTRRIFPLG